MRINVTQIKIEIIIYYFNIYIYIYKGEEGIKEKNAKRMKEREIKRENEKNKENFFFYGCSLHGYKKTFIAFTI